VRYCGPTPIQGCRRGEGCFSSPTLTNLSTPLLLCSDAFACTSRPIITTDIKYTWHLWKYDVGIDLQKRASYSHHAPVWSISCFVHLIVAWVWILYSCVLKGSCIVQACTEYSTVFYRTGSHIHIFFLKLASHLHAAFEQGLSTSWWMQTESAQVSTRSKWDLLPGVWLLLARIKDKQW